MLIDTTILIDALRGRPAAEKLRGLRAQGDIPCICAVNSEEIFRGVRAAERAVTEAFLGGFAAVSLGLGEGATAGTWRREYAARGVTLSQADCLVAAAAVSVGGRLATGNPRHFPMPQVDVDHWPVGG